MRDAACARESEIATNLMPPTPTSPQQPDEPFADEASAERGGKIWSLAARRKRSVAGGHDGAPSPSDPRDESFEGTSSSVSSDTFDGGAPATTRGGGEHSPPSAAGGGDAAAREAEVLGRLVV